MPVLRDLLKEDVDFMELDDATENQRAALTDSSKVVLLENLLFDVAE